MNRICVSAILGATTLLAACAGSDHPRIAYAALGDSSTVEATPGVMSTEVWKFGAVEGEIIRTAHYRVFTTEKDAALRDRMPRFLEYALAAYRQFAGILPPPPQKLDTYLMDNRPQWEQLTARLMGAEAKDIGNIQRGGFASRGIGVYYDLGMFDTLAIAGHEGWHQYTQRTFRDPLPTWLEEGIATQFEGYGWLGGPSGKPEFRSWSNLERFDRLRELVADDRLMPLTSVLASQPQDFLAETGTGLLDYYAHVWVLVHFLREDAHGARMPALTRLLADAARGELRTELARVAGATEAARAMASRTGTTVFTTYFGADLAAADAAFRAFATAAVRPGGRELITAGKSPVASE